MVGLTQEKSVPAQVYPVWAMLTFCHGLDEMIMLKFIIVWESLLAYIPSIQGVAELKLAINSFKEYFSIVRIMNQAFPFTVCKNWMVGMLGEVK